MQFFAFILIIVATIVKAREDFVDMKSQNEFNSDVTDQHLTDSDLKLALSDLSFKDLKSLQALIDSADYNDVDHEENGITNEKISSYDYDQQDVDNSNDNKDYNDDSFEPKDIESNLVNYLKRGTTFHTFSRANLREKRDDQKLRNDEYLKQLVYSFPQNEQLNYNDAEGEKFHIRVKRN